MPAASKSNIHGQAHGRIVLKISNPGGG
jgi:hypothetical protein